MEPGNEAKPGLTPCGLVAGHFNFDLNSETMKHILTLLLTFLFAGQLAAKTNVMVILADDMGFSDANCYGSEIATPNLDRLAAGGVRFSQFYNTARCWPTRGALLTGYYAQAINRDALPKLGGGGRGVRPGWAALLPQMLRPLGYRSYLSGKWHVDGVPIEQGFDHSYVIEDHDRFHNPKKHLRDNKPLPAIAKDSGFYLTTYIADHAIECLQEHAKDHADQPFFHFLAFTSPHFPLQALPEDIAKYAKQYNVGWDVIRQNRYAKQRALGLISSPLSQLESAIGPPYDFPADITKLGPGEVNRELAWNELNDIQHEFQTAKMAVHAAMIDRMDIEIGRVLDQLKAMNKFDDTLILFLSDNGASAEIMVRGDGHDPKVPIGAADSFVCLGPGWSSAANTPFRRHKTWVHEGGIATSMIAHWPQGIKASSKWRARPSHVIDIVPTVLELAGGTWPYQAAGLPQLDPAIRGESFLNSLTSEADQTRTAPLWWLHEENKAIRDGQWKAVLAKGEQWQLYDLTTDRAETHDLASEQPTKLKELVAQWEKMTEAMKRGR